MLPRAFPHPPIIQRVALPPACLYSGGTFAEATDEICALHPCRSALTACVDTASVKEKAAMQMLAGRHRCGPLCAHQASLDAYSRVLMKN